MVLHSEFCSLATELGEDGVTPQHELSAATACWNTVAEAPSLPAKVLIVDMLER